MIASAYVVPGARLLEEGICGAVTWRKYYSGHLRSLVINNVYPEKRNKGFLFEMVQSNAVLKGGTGMMFVEHLMNLS